MEEGRSELLAETKAVLRSLCISRKEQMRLSELARDYRDMSQAEVPYLLFGHSSLLQFVKTDLADALQLSDHSDRFDPVVKPIIIEQLKDLHRLISRQKPSTTKGRFRPTPTTNNRHQHTNNNNNNVLPSTTKSDANVHKRSERDEYRNLVETNLKTLIGKFKANGLWNGDCLAEYKKMFNAPLNYKKLGYDSLIGMCASMPAVFLIDRPDELGDWKLYPAGTKLPQAVVKTNPSTKRKWTQVNNPIDADQTVDALPGVPSNIVFYKSDCMANHEGIERLEIPKVGQTLELYISDINNPLDFYYQLCSVEHSSALIRMMTELNQFYKDTSDDYSMSKAIMRAGQYLAAPYNNYYHRAYVRQIIGNDLIEVFYIDYGTICTLGVQQMRQLPKYFAKMPAQAIRGSLAGDLHLANWDPKKQMCETKRLFGEEVLSGIVKAVDFKMRKVWLDLTPKSGVNIVESMKNAGILKVTNNNNVDELSKNMDMLKIERQNKSEYTKENDRETIFSKVVYSPRVLQNIPLPPSSQSDQSTSISSSTKSKNFNNLVKIALIEFKLYFGTYLEIWAIIYNGIQTGGEMCIAEQVAKSFTISGEEELKLLKKFYSTLDPVRCVQHSSSLSSLKSQIAHRGKTGYRPEETIENLKLVENIEPDNNHVLLVPFNDFVTILNSYRNIK